MVNWREDRWSYNEHCWALELTKAGLFPVPEKCCYAWSEENLLESYDIHNAINCFNVQDEDYFRQHPWLIKHNVYTPRGSLQLRGPLGNFNLTWSISLPE